MFAPELTAMVLSPSAVTSTIACPVGRGARSTDSVATPSAAISPSSQSPSASMPTAPTIATRRPSRAAATAWLAPLPPPVRRWSAAPSTV